MKIFLICSAILACAVAQQQNTTPVPILKQINRHNEDGSYSYGYEAADGSYKIESKYPTGEVFGKYGYVDDGGKLREIEYGASRRGFEPAGNEINVPPPTLQQNNAAIRPLNPNEEDDGQYREDPSVYYKDEKYNNPAPARSAQPAPQQYNYQQQSQYQQPQYQPQQQQQHQQITGFLNNYQQPRNYQQPAQPAFRPQPSYQQPQARYYNPDHANFNPYAGHPASNFDVASGSYSVQYRR